MPVKHKRRKQPEQTRLLLIDAAFQIAAKSGIDNITLDLVAKEAGLSKGGLLHHFKNRQELIRAMCAELLGRLDDKIYAIMADDIDETGCASRAYLKATTDTTDAVPMCQLMFVVTTAAIHDEELAKYKTFWLNDLIYKHGEDPTDTSGLMVRYGADGIWLSDAVLGEYIESEARSQTLSELLKLSYKVGMRATV